MTPKPLALLFLLLTSALAGPVANSPSKPFTLTIAHNRDTALNGQIINAADQALFLGLASPSTYCPSPSTVPPSQCPAGTETVFGGLLSMAVKVPGGQQAYVGPDGALGYSQAHSAVIPTGAFTQGFSWTPLHTNSVTGERGQLNFAAPGATKSGFWACANIPGAFPGSTYKIFAQVPGFTQKNCIELGVLMTTEFTQDAFGAWQYT